jgi:hypothetical protein
MRKEKILPEICISWAQLRRDALVDTVSISGSVAWVNFHFKMAY